MAVESAISLKPVNPLSTILYYATTTALQTKIIYNDHIYRALERRDLESYLEKELERSLQGLIERYLFLLCLPKSSSILT